MVCLMRLKHHFLLGMVLAIAALPSSLSHAQSHYQTPSAFMALFYDFTGSSNKNYPPSKINISQNLYKTVTQASSSTAQDGPLILFINSNLYIYDNARNQLLALDMRTSPDTGFYELTAISHVGPALAYLAFMKQQGGTSWLNGLKQLKKNLIAVKKINAKPNNNWIERVNAPSWKPYRKQINSMVDYACSMAGNYINRVLNNPDAFNMNDLQTHFLEGNTDYPIPYNNVMIGTFMLTAYESMNRIHDAIASVDIDWKKAKVLIRFVAGSNITAGVSVNSRSNWLVPFIVGLSKNQLSRQRIFISPYADVKPSLGQKKLSADDFNYYNYAWSRTYNRVRIANAVFTNITSIFIPQRPVIPGDFRYSREPSINDFLMRLKYSLANPTEMLANTVAFWMSGELHANHWDLSKVEIPGFTRDFPQGLSQYPADNPEIA